MEYESGRPAVRKKIKPPGRRKIALILAAVFVILLGAGGYAFFSRTSVKAPFFATRAVNAFSFFVLGRNPHFYYLLVEKNGKDYQLSAQDAFDLSYRDEFVIKGIVSDDLLEKGVAVDVEGLGEKNDFRRLLKGIELIDKLMTVSKGGPPAGQVPEHHINVLYRDSVIARIPMKVTITPQDFLRYAKDSDDKRLQADYLKQAIAVNRELGWDTDKINVNGGAIALGHPIGASGARVLVSLLHEMQKRDAKKGLATLCIGGGMGVAMCVER